KFFGWQAPDRPRLTDVSARQTVISLRRATVRRHCSYPKIQRRLTSRRRAALMSCLQNLDVRPRLFSQRGGSRFQPLAHTQLTHPLGMLGYIVMIVFKKRPAPPFPTGVASRIKSGFVTVRNRYRNQRGDTSRGVGSNGYLC